MRWLWLVVVGVVGWLVLVLRTMPQWLAGRVSLPRHDPEPTPDTAQVDQAADRAATDAIEKAEQAKAGAAAAVAELHQTVAETTSTRSKSKRRLLLQKLADKADDR